ncbi:MAG: hypothetical protein WBC70_09235 [Candidatus Aminicenantales bacterium]
MNKNRFLSFATLLMILLCSCQEKQTEPAEPEPLSGPYLGQSPPGETPELFAPGIVSKEGYQGEMSVPPDLNESPLYRRMGSIFSSPATAISTGWIRRSSKNLNLWN